MNEEDKTFFTNAYLMITSVIQAAALGALVFAIDSLQRLDKLCENWPFLMLSFITTVVLSYGYVNGSRRLRWPLDGFDILIPFLMGLLQSIAPLSLVSGPSCYFWLYLIFTFTGFLALGNSWIKTAIFAKDIYQERYSTRIVTLFALLVMSLLCIVPLVIHGLTKSTAFFTWFAYGLTLLYGLLFFGWCCRDWRQTISQQPTPADRELPAPSGPSTPGN